MPPSKKKVGLIGAGLGAAAAAALRSRWARSEAGSATPATPASSPSGEEFLERLAAAIRIPTVSTDEGYDEATFDHFHRFLDETFPLVHGRLGRGTGGRWREAGDLTDAQRNRFLRPC